MKNFALILFVGFALLACSDDDEKVEYSETLGYLTNLTSVKHGVQDGVWESIPPYSRIRYNPDGTSYTTVIESGLSWQGQYELIERNGKFIIRIIPIDISNGYEEYEIIRLDKEYFYVSNLEFEQILKIKKVAD